LELTPLRVSIHEREYKNTSARLKEKKIINDDDLKLPETLQKDYRANQVALRPKCKTLIVNETMPPISGTYKYMETDQHTSVKSIFANSSKAHPQLTIKKSRHTFRVEFNDRKKMRYRNVIIMHFEGVIGDIQSEHFDDEIERVLCIRKGHAFM
jgi:hypothetical protein